MGAGNLQGYVALLERQIDELQGAGEIDGTTAQSLEIALEEVRTANDEVLSLGERVVRERERVVRERERLLEERDEVAQLFENVPLACLTTDRNGIVRRANAAVADLLLAPPRYLRGKPLAAFVVEDERELFIDLMTRCANNGTCGELELHLRSRGDEPSVPVRAVAQPVDVSSSDGSLLQWSFSDVSDVVDTRREVLRLREALRGFLLLHSTPTNDFTLRLRALLRTGCDLFGFRFGEIYRCTDGGAEFLARVGESPPYAADEIDTDETFHCMVLDDARPFLIHDASDPDFSEHPASSEHGVMSYVGTPLWVNGEATAVMGFYDTHIGAQQMHGVDMELLQVLADSASMEIWRSQMVDVLQEKQKRLLNVRKMETLGRLTCSVAHDFNNVLNAIVRCAETGMRRAEDEEDPWLRQIVDAASRGGVLTRQLLQAGRETEVELEYINVNTLIRGLEELLRNSTSDLVDLRFDFGGDVGGVFGTHVGLEQVLLNLVSNASEAMPDGGTITVRTTLRDVSSSEAVDYNVDPGQFVTVCVEDDGVGMDARTRKKLFEPYFTTRGDAGGTGIGLTTVAALVSEFRGFVDVDTEPGEGSTFSVHLPSATIELAEWTDPPTLDVDREESVDDGDVAGFGILVVEGFRTSRVPISMLLSDQAYNIFEAHTVCEAREVFADYGSRIHAVICEEQLRNGEGLDLIREFSAERPDIASLLVSNGIERHAVANLLKQEDIGVLTLPTSKERLYDAVTELIRTWMRRNNYAKSG